MRSALETSEASFIKRFRVLLFAVLTTVAAFAAVDSNHALGADPTVAYAPDDPEMARAIALARGSLGTYFSVVQSKPSGIENPSLKVAIPKSDGDGHEHIWVMDVAADGPGTYVGIIANEPAFLDGIQIGDQYAFKRDGITDWMFMRDGRLHGGFTVRVMLPRLPEDQASSLRAILAPLP